MLGSNACVSSAASCLLRADDVCHPVQCFECAVQLLPFEIWRLLFFIENPNIFSIKADPRHRHDERSPHMYSNRFYTFIIGSNRKMVPGGQTSTSHEDGRELGHRGKLHASLELRQALQAFNVGHTV
jgi:hypothetical protein